MTLQQVRCRGVVFGGRITPDLTAPPKILTAPPYRHRRQIIICLRSSYILEVKCEKGGVKIFAPEVTSSSKKKILCTPLLMVALPVSYKSSFSAYRFSERIFSHDSSPVSG